MPAPRTQQCSPEATRTCGKPAGIEFNSADRQWRDCASVLEAQGWKCKPVGLVAQVNEDDVKGDALVEESQPDSLTERAPRVRIPVQHHWFGAAHSELGGQRRVGRSSGLHSLADSVARL